MGIVYVFIFDLYLARSVSAPSMKTRRDDSITAVREHPVTTGGRGDVWATPLHEHTLNVCICVRIDICILLHGMEVRKRDGRNGYFSFDVADANDDVKENNECVWCDAGAHELCIGRTAGFGVCLR